MILVYSTDVKTQISFTQTPEAPILVVDDSDVVAATQAVQKKSSRKIYTEVVPDLEKLGIKYNITKNGKGVNFKVGEYHLRLYGRTGGKYTLTIWSKTKSTEQALLDFPHSQELSASSTDESSRRARIPMSQLSIIMQSIQHFASNQDA